jgi:hypothetical protein
MILHLPIPKLHVETEGLNILADLKMFQYKFELYLGQQIGSTSMFPLSHAHVHACTRMPIIKSIQIGN